MSHRPLANFSSLKITAAYSTNDAMNINHHYSSGCYNYHDVINAKSVSSDE
jgi:hypothetical protein